MQWSEISDTSWAWTLFATPRRFIVDNDKLEFILNQFSYERRQEVWCVRKKLSNSRVIKQAQQFEGLQIEPRYWMPQKTLKSYSKKIFKLGGRWQKSIWSLGKTFGAWVCTHWPDSSRTLKMVLVVSINCLRNWDGRTLLKYLKIVWKQVNAHTWLKQRL